MIRRVVPAGEVTLSLKTLERLLRTIREQKELNDTSKIVHNLYDEVAPKV